MKDNLIVHVVFLDNIMYSPISTEKIFYEKSKITNIFFDLPLACVFSLLCDQVGADCRLS